jgi:hypothetical protein
MPWHLAASLVGANAPMVLDVREPAGFGKLLSTRTNVRWSHSDLMGDLATVATPTIQAGQTRAPFFNEAAVISAVLS